jgi:pimeloyl-ACP methyl ester carboxylesterase
MALPSAAKLDPNEEHFRIPSPIDGLTLFLRYLPPTERKAEPRVVLYVHGGTFPSALSIAHRFDGRSWGDELADAGFHVWGLDFHGFGASDRYPEMAEAAEQNPPLGRADIACPQIERAVRFICDRHQVPRISIIAHSWGTIAAGRFAGESPELVDRLVFFGPVTWRPKKKEPPTFPAWRLVSIKDQWDRFTEEVPADEPPVLSKRHFDEWASLYLDTDAESRMRSPASVKTPSGPWQDIAAAWAGDLAYDPGLIRAPLAICRGEWDSLATDSDARWLFDALRSSPMRRDIKIGRATHLMHLEENRRALYRESIAFLQDRGRASITQCQTGGRVMAQTAADKPNIPGYDYGSDNVAKSPITMAELEQLKKSAFFSDEDVFYLRLSHDVLADQVDDLLKVWRGTIFLNPHLRAYDENPQTGEVDTAYASAVGKRFGQWVLDTAIAEYDQKWLDYQYEIGLRHHRTKKNKTDNAHTTGHIRARDLIAFSAAIVAPMKPFLARKGHSAEVVSRMYDAWWKSMILQVTLWTQPYMREGDF